MRPAIIYQRFLLVWFLGFSACEYALYPMTYLGCLMQPALTIEPAELPEATAGQFYQQSFKVVGAKTPVGTVVIESGALPEGLALQHVKREPNFEISGQTHKVGVYQFTIRSESYGTQCPGQKTSSKPYTLIVH